MKMPVSAACLATAFALAGCEQKSKNVNIVSGPPPQTKPRSEPVFYNGKNYQVDFAYAKAQGAYNVTVAGRHGRPLGGKPGDQKIVEQLASSAIGHFACLSSQKGRIVPGSASHGKGKWKMQARCA